MKSAKIIAALTLLLRRLYFCHGACEEEEDLEDWKKCLANNSPAVNNVELLSEEALDGEEVLCPFTGLRHDGEPRDLEGALDVLWSEVEDFEESEQCQFEYESIQSDEPVEIINQYGERISSPRMNLQLLAARFSVMPVDHFNVLIEMLLAIVPQSTEDRVWRKLGEELPIAALRDRPDVFENLLEDAIAINPDLLSDLDFLASTLPDDWSGFSSRQIHAGAMFWLVVGIGACAAAAVSVPKLWPKRRHGKGGRRNVSAPAPTARAPANHQVGRRNKRGKKRGANRCRTKPQGRSKPHRQDPIVATPESQVEVQQSGSSSGEGHGAEAKLHGRGNQSDPWLATSEKSKDNLITDGCDGGSVNDCSSATKEISDTLLAEECSGDFERDFSGNIISEPAIKDAITVMLSLPRQRMYMSTCSTAVIDMENDKEGVEK